jgi:hypothetical protein
LIEELINIEIIDESDTITDNREKKKVHIPSIPMRPEGLAAAEVCHC